MLISSGALLVVDLNAKQLLKRFRVLLRSNYYFDMLAEMIQMRNEMEVLLCIVNKYLYTNCNRTILCINRACIFDLTQGRKKSEYSLEMQEADGYRALSLSSSSSIVSR